MKAPHKEGLFIRFGWVMLYMHEVDQSGFCLTPNSIGASLGGVTYHDDTYNRALPYEEFVERVVNTYSTRSLTLSNGLLIKGHVIVPRLREVLNRAIPYVYETATHEFVTRFDIFVTSQGEIYAS